MTTTPFVTTPALRPYMQSTMQCIFPSAQQGEISEWFRQAFAQCELKKCSMCSGTIPQPPPTPPPAPGPTKPPQEIPAPAPAPATCDVASMSPVAPPKRKQARPRPAPRPPPQQQEAKVPCLAPEGSTSTSASASSSSSGSGEDDGGGCGDSDSEDEGSGGGGGGCNDRAERKRLRDRVATYVQGRTSKQGNAQTNGHILRMLQQELTDMVKARCAEPYAFSAPQPIFPPRSRKPVMKDRMNQNRRRKYRYDLKCIDWHMHEMQVILSGVPRDAA